MSLSPIGGSTNLPAIQPPAATQIPSQTGAATVTPTAGAAQSWESALRAALGDDSSTAGATSANPLISALAGETAAGANVPASSSGARAAEPLTSALGTSPAGLLSLLTGGSASAADPLLTSLSQSPGATTDPLTSPTSAGALLSSTDPSLANDGLSSLV